MSIKSDDTEFSYNYSAWIPLELPDLNAYNKASRSIHGAVLANKIKQDTQRKISLFLKQPKKPLLTPCKAVLSWYIPNKRKDPDNIAFAVKFIFDALVARQIIANDNLNYINGIEHLFYVSKEQKGVNLLLITREEAK